MQCNFTSCIHYITVSVYERIEYSRLWITSTDDDTLVYYGPYNMCTPYNSRAPNGKFAEAYGYSLELTESGLLTWDLDYYNANDCNAHKLVSSKVIKEDQYSSPTNCTAGDMVVSIVDTFSNDLACDVSGQYVQQQLYADPSCTIGVQCKCTSVGACIPPEVYKAEMPSSCSTFASTAMPTAGPIATSKPTGGEGPNRRLQEDNNYAYTAFDSSGFLHAYCDNECRVDSGVSINYNNTGGACTRSEYLEGWVKWVIPPPPPPSEEEIILNSSPFEIVWTPQFVSVKMKKYFGGYIIYFASLFVFLFVVDKSSVLKLLSKKLHDSASVKYNKPILITKKSLDGNRRIKYLDDLIGDSKNEGEDDTAAAAEQPTSIRATEVIVVPDAIEKEDNRDSVLKKVAQNWAKYAPYPIDQTTAAYSKQFYEFLEACFIYMDCDVIMTPRGLFNMIFMLDPGQSEDMLLYVFNHHSFISCMTAAKKSFFSRSKRRIAFSMQHSLAFFFVAFNLSLTSVGMPESVAVFFNLFLIAPLLSTFNKLFQQLLICSCLRDGPMKERLSGLVEWIDASGYFTAICMMIGGFLLLLFATMFTTGKSSFGILGEYALQVQFYSFILEILEIRLRAVSSIYLKVQCNFLGSPHIWESVLGEQAAALVGYLSFSMGERFVEMIARTGAVENVDYYNLSPVKRRCELLAIEFLASKSWADRWGYKAPSVGSTSTITPIENPMQQNENL